MDDIFYSSFSAATATAQPHHHNNNNIMFSSHPFIGKDVELTTGLMATTANVSSNNKNKAILLSDLFGVNDDGENDEDAFFTCHPAGHLISEFPEIPSDLFEDTSATDLMDDDPLALLSSNHDNNSDDLLQNNAMIMVAPEFLQQQQNFSSSSSSSSSASNSPQYSPDAYSSSDSPEQQPQLIFSVVSDSDSSSSSSGQLQADDVKPIIVHHQGGAVVPAAPAAAPPPRRISRGRVNSQTPLTAETAELAAMKRHIRMIRNRESASLSRKKKKEYVTSLEERVKVLENQVSALQQENCSLRVKLAVQAKEQQQQQQNKTIGSKVAMGTVTTTKAVALFSLCFFCAVLTTNNVGGFHGNTAVGNRSDNSGGGGNFSRVLLRNSSRFVAKAGHKVKVDDEFAKFKAKGNGTSNKCGEATGEVFFNVTESRRVQSRLEGLFKVPPPLQKQRKGPGAPLVYSLIAPSAVTNNEIKRGSRGGEDDAAVAATDAVSKGLTVYGGGGDSSSSDSRRGGGDRFLGGEYASILNKLERREDTFYVVSLTAENYLLLSAKSANESSRPKMTLLMPWRNETSGGVEELMQIDCEVFQVFNLNKKPRQQQQDSKRQQNQQRQKSSTSTTTTLRRNFRNGTTSSNNRNSSRRG